MYRVWTVRRTALPLRSRNENSNQTLVREGKTNLEAGGRRRAFKGGSSLRIGNFYLPVLHAQLGYPYAEL